MPNLAHLKNLWCAGVPTTLLGFEIYDRKEIKDALAYLRVIVNAADRVSLLRVINTPRRGMGKPAWTRSQQSPRIRCDFLGNLKRRNIS